MTYVKPPYSRRSLARLTLSLSAAQLADRARGCVRTIDDSWGRPGEFVHQALSLLDAAEELVQRAVIVEREHGTSWAVLGEILDVTRQGAQQKYGEVVDEWTEATNDAMQATKTGIVAPVLPGEGPDTPEEHAARLDAWALRHADKASTRAREQKPVSGGLQHASITEQIAMLVRIAGRIRDERDPARLRAFHECKAALLAASAEEDPSDAGAAERAESARLELAGLPKAVRSTRTAVKSRKLLN